jgi:DNA repair photolyase
MSDRDPPLAEHRDALLQGRVRGRGAGLNPGNRFDDRGGGGVRLHVLGEHLDEQAAEHPGGTQVATVMLDDDTRSIINRVDSPDFAFHWTLNPYRGCEHGCIYCYARPTHETLGFSCGLDFETRIMVKRDAPALLRRALGDERWRAEPIALSGVTDPYQPVERERRVTRGCLEVMAACRQPVGVITKSRLVTRDVDLLAELAARHAAVAGISLTTLDAGLAARLEPRASAPRDRLRAIRALAEAGVPVTAMIAPVIPGLTDHEIPALLEAAADAGATSAGWILLRLPHQVRGLFLDWLHRHAPERAERVVRAIGDTRDGRLNETGFGVRLRGRGPRAEHIDRTFRVFRKRHGLDGGSPPLSSAAFERPGQLDLFPRA